jgi:hypothetical protein
MGNAVQVMAQNASVLLFAVAGLDYAGCADM